MGKGGRKILVVFYSRDGHTKRIAKLLAKKLDADLDEVKDLKNRNGFFAWIIAGFDALFGRMTNISYKKKVKDYDILVIGSPIWYGTYVPAINTYLQENRDKIDHFAFFCSSGSRSIIKAKKRFEKLGKQPFYILNVGENDIGSKCYFEDVEVFCKGIKDRI